MRIIAIQLNMAWEDKAANHSRVRNLLESATVQPGDLIVLPEMFETGFSMNPAATAQSEKREGEAFLKSLAHEYQSAVLGGVASPLTNGMARNEAVAFAPSGQELVRYQKQKPFSLSGEEKHYPPGDVHKLFTWQGIQIAPFICYDLRFPELFRRAVREGAEMFIVIACWPAKRSEHWFRLLQARAIENLAVTIGINRCGSEPGLEFDGRTCGFDHMGINLFECGPEEQVRIQAVDLEETRRWRTKFPALRDME